MFTLRLAGVLLFAVFTVFAGPVTTGPIVYEGQLTAGTNLGDNGPYAAPSTAPVAHLFLETIYTGVPIVNCAGPGTCSSLSLGLTALPYGTYLVYLLHYDVTPNPNLLSPIVLPQNAAYGIVFDAPIAGILANTAALTLADLVVGVPGVTYPTGLLEARGLDLPDSMVVDAGNPAWLRSINLRTSIGVDEVRILVPTPEPAATLLMGGGLGLLVYLRKRWGNFTHRG